MTILEHITARLAHVRQGDSFGIERRDGSVTFVYAHNFEIDRDGRLTFHLAGRGVAAYNAGEWVRVMRGLTPDDVKQGGGAE